MFYYNKRKRLNLYYIFFNDFFVHEIMKKKVNFLLYFQINRQILAFSNKQFCEQAVDKCEIGFFSGRTFGTPILGCTTGIPDESEQVLIAYHCLFQLKSGKPPRLDSATCL